MFTSLMLATWIRAFTKDNAPANEIAGKWKEIVAAAFSGGEYDHAAWGIKPKGGRLINLVQFYTVNLLQDCLDAKTESAFLDYILDHEARGFIISMKAGCARRRPSLRAKTPAVISALWKYLRNIR